MDAFLKQLACMKAVPDSTGAITYSFSLDVLLANGVSFAAGFCLEWFLLHDVIFGGK